MTDLARTAHGPLCAILLSIIQINAILSTEPGRPSDRQERTQSPEHDRAFWHSIAEHGFAPPPEASVSVLVSELSYLLRSPDPELRDEIGYSILAQWIYQKRLIDQKILRSLMDEWLANLKTEIDVPGTDTAFGQSFSALALSLIAALDNTAPFLEPAEFGRLFDAALEYLRAERDLRGYDVQKGWLHSAAHTADLLKFLGRNRQLNRSDQAVLLQAISSKLTSASVVFTHGEDERFARAVLSLVDRDDFDHDAFIQWVGRWRPTPITAPHPSEQQLRSTQNMKNLYTKLEVLLTFDTRPRDATRDALDAVRGALKGLF